MCYHWDTFWCSQGWTPTASTSTSKSFPLHINLINECSILLWITPHFVSQYFSVSKLSCDIFQDLMVNILQTLLGGTHCSSLGASILPLNNWLKNLEAMQSGWNWQLTAIVMHMHKRVWTIYGCLVCVWDYCSLTLAFWEKIINHSFTKCFWVIGLMLMNTAL